MQTIRPIFKYGCFNVQIRACSSKLPQSVEPPKKNTLHQELQQIELKNKDLPMRKPKLPSKEDMIWRRTWHDEHNQRFSLLRAFYDESSYAPIIKFLQMDWKAFKKLYNEKRLEMIKNTQAYLPERNQLLGNELAAAHFLVYRGGAVKFHDDDRWIKADKDGHCELPRNFLEGMYIQGLDCSESQLYYEGLVNFRDLKNVEWLSLNGCDLLDDWALDRIGNLFSQSLIYLDIRNMPNISHRGIGALCKLENLKIIKVSDDFYESKEHELTLLLLQELNPMLDIRLEVSELSLPEPEKEK